MTIFPFHEPSTFTLQTSAEHVCHNEFCSKMTVAAHKLILAAHERQVNAAHSI